LRRQAGQAVEERALPLAEPLQGEDSTCIPLPGRLTPHQAADIVP
jgi:hypothetical protein